MALRGYSESQGSCMPKNRSDGFQPPEGLLSAMKAACSLFGPQNVSAGGSRGVAPPAGESGMTGECPVGTPLLRLKSL